MGKAYNYARGLSLEERFWNKVNKNTESGCWEWQASLDTKGYGNFGIPKNDGSGTFLMQRAHRIAWGLTHGILDTPAKHLCHKCDNRKCVNPEHLFVGDRFDNMRDCANKNRFNDRRGVKNPRAKLTEENVRNIRQSSDTYASLASKYKVAQSVIAYAKTGKSWSHIQ